MISLENHCLNSFDIPKRFVTLNESANVNVTVRLHFLSLVSKYRFVFRSWLSYAQDELPQEKIMRTLS